MPSLSAVVRGLATSSLLAAQADAVRAGARRVARRAALFAGAGLLAAIGAAFLLAAVYLQLSEWIGSKGAAALLAAVLMLAALGVWLVARAPAAPTQRKPTATSDMRSHLGSLGSALQALRRDAVRLAVEKPELVALGAFLVGVLSGRRSRNRRGD
jgi:hypothetical protein